MSKKLLLKGAVCCLIFGLSACKITLPKIATDNPIGPSTGESVCTCYLGIICPDGDMSINTAMENGKLVKVSTIDVQKKVGILGIVTQYKTIVTGYTKEQLLEENQKVAIENSSKSDLKMTTTEEVPVKKPLASKLVEEENSKVPQKTELAYSAVNETKNEVVNEKLIKSEKESSSPSKKMSAAERIKLAEEQLKEIEGISVRTSKPAATNKAPKETSKESINKQKINKEILVENEFSEGDIAGLTQIKVKGTSLSDLSNKVKAITEIKMKNGDLFPIDIELNFKTNTFSCSFVKKNAALIKLGIYFGPKNLGCESCDNVIIRNPGSVVLLNEISGNLLVQVIAIKKSN